MYHFELKITDDNSHTLFVKELNETYHSTNGAIVESRHIFMQKGLNDFITKSEKKQFSVFEVGFGTGLNAHLAHLFAQENNLKINYISVEAFPLPNEIIEQLNYTDLIKSSPNQFKILHKVAWDKPVEIDENFTLIKLYQQLDKVNLSDKIDVIFFDAFAPDVQPEMWTKSIFEKMYEILNLDGILVTYCAKGSIKRIVKEVGFELETLIGPPGKREMTRAIKRN